MTFTQAISRMAVLLVAVVAGCTSPPAPAPAPVERPASFNERLVPYVPTSRPADPVTEAFPDSPRDAQRAVPLRFTVELWEILLPRDSVSTDEAFWKRVDEPVGPDGQQLQKNGIRYGELPSSDIETVRKLIEDRGGKRTAYTGVEGREVQIPIASDVLNQMVFYHNRDDELVGRTWERADHFFYFSFETTPRNPDRLRVALTPAVRSREKKTVYAVAPGRSDRELRTVIEQSNYDVTVAVDLPLNRVLVIAPSAAARTPYTLGGTFLMAANETRVRERLIIVIPHAYTRDERAEAAR